LLDGKHVPARAGRCRRGRPGRQIFAGVLLRRIEFGRFGELIRSFALQKQALPAARQVLARPSLFALSTSNREEKSQPNDMKLGFPKRERREGAT
jgi:hypothetical protein